MLTLALSIGYITLYMVI